ncbi:probable cytochrome P450 28a5 isoform X2 [Wyeomyia smithii]|uniref:probable cytochrome P450 28a5 isoform X2 n=1 Tax=Wyeomyia smithii TaxID=174621 RepID=UPI002468194F|nr:probable cytochrome P450 28a5 isoform X2 [Wyeomyia smithii]
MEIKSLGALYVYLVWNFNYWKQRDVPGPTPTALLGNFPAFILRHRPFIDEMDEIYRNYKRKYNFVGVFTNRSPGIFVLSAGLAKDILVKKFKNFHDNEFSESTSKTADPILGRHPFMLSGEEWKEKRAEITPAFTTARMKPLFSNVEVAATQMKEYIEQCEGSSLDARELAAKFTTNAVSSCIFAVDAQSFSHEKPEIREMSRRLMEHSFMSFIQFLFVGAFPKIANMLNVGIVSKSVEKFFTKLMAQAIQHRTSATEKPVDYLDFLINLQNRKQLSALDMAAHGVTFFLDGLETSSSAISFVLYELARNPSIQQRLREELLHATNVDGTISYDTLLDLPYLDQVLNEALRLWPPGAFMSKRCTEPIDLDLTSNQNVRIEKGVCAIINIWSIHRDPDYYNDPLTFDPDRFHPETGGTGPYREKGCFIPFGEGPRQCLGMRFARMQVKRGIYEVIKNFKLTLDPKTRIPLQIDPKQFLTVALGGIWLKFEAIRM